MADLNTIMSQVTGEALSRPGIQNILNDKGLRLDPSSGTNVITVIGASNNNRVDQNGDPILDINEPLRILDVSDVDILLNNRSGGATGNSPSELTAMVNDALSSGGTNIQVVCTSKTVATLEKTLNKTDTVLPVSTPWSNRFTNEDVYENAPTPVWGAAAYEHNGKLYLFGGVNEAGNTVDLVQILDLDDGDWIVANTNLPYAVAHAAVVGLDDRVALIGGSTYAAGDETILPASATDENVIFLTVTGPDISSVEDEVLVEDPSGSPTYFSITRASAVLVGDEIHVIGGYDDLEDEPTSDVHVIDDISVDSGEVVSTYDLGQPVGNATAYIHEGTIYVFGGTTTGSVSAPAGLAAATNRVLAFEPDDTAVEPEEWTLTTPRANYVLSKSADSDKLFVIGGRSGSTNLSTIEYIDLSKAPADRRFNNVAGYVLPVSVVYGAAAADSDGLKIVYSTNEGTYVLNYGLGNLEALGFPALDGLITEFEIQINNELMLVDGYSVVRGPDGREYDALIVDERGYKSSPITNHPRGSDVFEGQETLYEQLNASYNSLFNVRTDYVAPTPRAYADSPYLPAGKNFAHALAVICYAKSRISNITLGTIGVLPAWKDPTKMPSQAELDTWVNHLANFDRLNWQNEEVWRIADGYTLTVGSDYPDTYAFWATETGDIPEGTPPALDARVLSDLKGNPVDIGAFISVVVFDYNGFNNIARRKHGDSIQRFWAKSGSVAYAGTLAQLPVNRGSTAWPITAGPLIRRLSALQVARLAERRYVVGDAADGPYRISQGSTFAHATSSPAVRSDFALVSTMRITKTVIDGVRNIIADYMGRPAMYTRPALESEISSYLTSIKPSLILDGSFRIKQDEVGFVLGEEEVELTIQPQMERRKVVIVTSLDVTTI